MNEDRSMSRATAAIISLLAPAALLGMNLDSVPPPPSYAPSADAIEQAVDQAQALVEDKPEN
jgi:hypothetical protein